MNRREFVKTTGIVTVSGGALPTNSAGHGVDDEPTRPAAEPATDTDQTHARRITVTSW